MARYIITLDGCDLHKLLEGDEITCSFIPDSDIREIVVKLTPNALSNLFDIKKDEKSERN